MAKTFECRRDLVVACSADKVWDWVSNLRNIMTANQYHLEIDLDDANAASPRVGMDVPILHGIMGWKEFRIARVTKCKDYEIAWGERMPDDAKYEDFFPHSEGWRIESLGPNQCRIHTVLRGRFMTPVGKLIGEYVWDKALPISLDNDIEDVALRAGAIEHKTRERPPQEVDSMLRLVLAQEIQGQPAADFLNQPFGMKIPVA